MEPLSWRVDGSITYQTIGDGMCKFILHLPSPEIKKDVVL